MRNSLLKIPFVCLLFITGTSSYAEHLVFDSSLSEQDKSVFISDLEVLSVIEDDIIDTKLRLALDLKYTRGNVFKDFLIENIVAVVPREFAPSMCLHPTSQNNLFTPGKAAERDSMINLLNSGDIQVCKSFRDENQKTKRFNLDAAAVDSDGVSVAFNGFYYFSSMGLRGGFYLSDGRFLPQNNNNSFILIIEPGLQKTPVVDATLHDKETVRGFMRISDYIAEVGGAKQYYECAKTQKSGCDKRREIKYIYYHLIKGIANYCQLCEESDKTALYYLAENSLRQSVGSDILRKIELKEFIVSNNHRMIELANKEENYTP